MLLIGVLDWLVAAVCVFVNRLEAFTCLLAYSFVRSLSCVFVCLTVCLLACLLVCLSACVCVCFITFFDRLCEALVCDVCLLSLFCSLT